MSARDSLFGLLAGLGFLRLLRAYRVRNKQVYVLTFHRISDEVCPLWPPMKVSVFEGIIDYLSRHANVVSPEFLISGEVNNNRKPIVVITFDDGYLDFFENALPVLIKYSMPCLHNICPGLINSSLLPWPQVVASYLKANLGARVDWLGGEGLDIPCSISESYFLDALSSLYRVKWDVLNGFIGDIRALIEVGPSIRLMGWGEIACCSANNVVIGSHSLEHENLASMSFSQSLKRMSDSKRLIEKKTDLNVKFFAYPSGQLPELSCELLLKSGFAFGFSSDQRALALDARGPVNNVLIPRLNMGCGGLAEEKARSHGFHSSVMSRRFF